MSVIQITKENFETEVLQAQVPVLLDFWAVWCGPCRMLAPVVEQVSEENEGKLAVGKVNVDDCPDLAMKFGVMSIPTLILCKDGQVVDKRVGYQPKNQLDDMIRKAF